jgi:alkyl sulfatase BDS1-like metallo-beta-lactamase superfamily hydrolase
MTRIICGLLLALSTALPTSLHTPVAAPLETTVHPDLAAHQARYAKPQLVRVTDRVYAAVGYSLSNIAFLVGDKGVVVYDTGMMLDEGQAALEALRGVTDKPIVAVIYSHGHLDHAGGVRAFVPAEQEGKIPLYANSRWPRYRSEQTIPKTPIRALYQMGGLLPVGPTGAVGNGAGPLMDFRGRFSFIAPTELIEDKLDLELVGIRLSLFHAPGDVDDGLAAWLPEERVLLAGDAAYAMFPALSTPRFDRHRDAWANLETLDHFRTLPVEHLVPGHLKVISGSEAVAHFLQQFRDAIQFMHDQTIRLLNQGLGPDEVANAVRASFPPHLASDPELVEYYQKLEWVVKGIYAKTGGWYGGDVVELVQIGPKQRSERLAALVGGAAKLRQAAREAYEAGDRPWAAELARHLVRLDPQSDEDRKFLAEVLQAIGYEARSANLRNYMLSEVLALNGTVDLKRFRLGRVAPDLLRPVPDSVLFRGLGPRLDPASSIGAETTAGFKFGGSSEEHTLIVRRGVIEYRAGRPAEADLRVEVERETWLLIAGGNLRWMDALASGALEATPSKQALQDFASLFDGQ